jgi:diacylglycerol kinase (ATP)
VKTRFIVNARSGAADHALPLVRAFATRHGAELMLTEHPGHGTELAAQAIADGCERIVAVGGDGTMNEVASALVGTSATLGLVPCGSGDGLGRHLRIHGPVEHALRVLDEGEPRLIDSGTADGHPFFTAAGMGFEAEIGQRFNQLRKRGFLRYLTTSFAAWRRYESQHYKIIHAGGEVQVHAFTLAVANSDQYGNDVRIAPRARVDDGRLNLTAIPPMTILNGMPLAWRLFGGTIDSAAGVVALNGTRFTVEREHPGLLHTDGELHDAGRSVAFIVKPASLRIIAPPPTSP